MPVTSTDSFMKAMERDSRCRTVTIRRVMSETHETRSFELDVSGEWPHVPGQHVKIGIDILGRRHQRHYSLSNVPTIDEPPRITVKRQGLVSSWMIENLAEGSTLDVSDPLGDFVLPQDSSEMLCSSEMLFLAAGSGITPIAAMARHAVNRGCRVTLLHVDRTPPDAIFRAEFLRLERQRPEKFIYKPWFTAKQGRPAFVLSELVAASEARMFICGPQGFMEACASAATDLRVPADRISQESFGRGSIDAGEEIKLSLRGAGEQSQTLRGRVGMSLLEALRAEVGFPSVCGGRAICGTCRVAVEDGSRVMLAPPNRAEARLLRVLPAHALTIVLPARSGWRLSTTAFALPPPR